MSLRMQTLRGMLWTGTSFASTFGMQLILGAILARLLTPEDFGIVAMTSLIVSFLGFFRGAGIGQALSVEREPSQQLLSSAYWYTLASGVVFAVLVALLAPVGGWLYDEPRVVPVFMLSGLAILVGSTSGVHGGLLARQLRFKTLAVRDVLAQVVGGIVAGVLAWQGYAFYALALQSVTAAAFKSLFLWGSSGWRPSFKFDWGPFKGLLQYGSHITAFQAFNYVWRNLDQFLLAKFLGPIDLAYYRQATQVIRLPTQTFHRVASRVMMPALAQVSDIARVRTSFVEAIRLICAVAWLPFAGLLVAAPEFVRILYGSQWDASAFLLQVFTIMAFGQMIGISMGWLYKSRGHAMLQSRVALAVTPVRFAALFIGLQYGVNGVAIAIAVSGYILIPLWYLSTRLVGLRLRVLLWSLAPQALATVGSIGAMLAVRLALLGTALNHPVLVVLAIAATGLATYPAFLWLVDRRLVREILALARDFRKAAKEGSIAPVPPSMAGPSTGGPNEPADETPRMP